MNSAIVGAFLMGAAGLMSTVDLVWSKLVKEWSWPYFRVQAVCVSVMALSIAAGLVATGKMKCPAKSDLKWLLLRSVFGTITFTMGVVAVQVGASPGDASALTSVNMVFAAVMGHLFLNEKLQWPHVLSLVCSLSGALLITKPAFLFGSSHGSATAWSGNVLALLAGLGQAAVFICARKSAGACTWLATVFTGAFCAPFFVLLPITGLIEDASLAPVAAQPWLAVIFVAVGLILCTTAICLNNAGAQMCPAAVSATVFTGTSMLSGYLVQIFIFKDSPRPLTIVGAGLMLSAILIMSFCRRQPTESKEDMQGIDVSVATRTIEEVARSSSASCSESDDTESLASFAASEFADVEPHLSVRLRRIRAETIGRAAEMVSASA